MKKTLLIQFMLLLFVSSIAQVTTSMSINNSAVSTAQFPGMCKSDKKHIDLMMNDPAYAAKRQSFHQQMKDYLDLAPSQRALSGTVTIPVVVHVIHNPSDPTTNISTAQIQSAIDNLNDAYSNDVSLYGNSVDIQVQFALAVRDENCQATTGINRVDGTSVSGYATDGITDANETQVKALSKWDNSKYYNIWIVTEIDGNDGGSGTQGYAYFPGASSDVDGAVILYNAFGYDPTGVLGYELKPYTNYNVTTIHELGHGLDLYHTFQGDDANSDGTADQCPGPADDGDFCADTDPHRRDDSDCDAPVDLTCNGVANSTVHNNFMAYTSDFCQDRFTSDQKDRMRAALELERPGLVSSLGATPITGSEPTASVSCAPQTQDLSNSFSMGIAEFGIGGTAYSSGGAVADGGYTTQWCYNFSLDESTQYSVNVEMPFTNNEDVAVYIDYNNDGDFEDAGEEVFTSSSATSHSGNFTTPAGFSGETVWVRVISEWAGNTITGPCYAPQYGQVEDYSATLNSTCTDPDVPVLSHSGTICDGSSATVNISGDLNSASQWVVYTGSCGGTQVTTTSSSSFTVTPTGPSTTYFVRGEGGCVTPGSCDQITLNVTSNDDASFSYDQATYCDDDADPTPTITGDAGGTFTFSPAGLVINGSTGQIDLGASTAQGYTVTYTTAGACPDNQGVAVTVQNCNLPTSQVRADNCGKTLGTISEKIWCEEVGGAALYEWEFTNTVTSQVTTYTRLNGIEYVRLGYMNLMDPGVTYDVRVRPYVGGQWGQFGATCQITSAVALPTTNVIAADCGITLSAFNQEISCEELGNANTDYEWELTDPSNNVTTFIRTNGREDFKLAHVGLYEPNITYDVRVRAYINGTWSDFGATCQVTSPSDALTTKMTNSDCGATLSAFNEYVYCDPIPGAVVYQWKLTDPSSNVYTINRFNSNRSFKLTQLNLTAPNITYDVEVRAKSSSGVWTDFGQVCQLTSPAGAALIVNDDPNASSLEKTSINVFAGGSSGITEELFDGMTAYPNPFKDEFNVDFGGNSYEKEIKIYNALGQVVRVINTADAYLTIEMRDLEQGVYIMQVIAEGRMKTIRLVKQ
ncbi:zinc-dependent metalloprotease [Parvicella tangerina]|uniref:T9SS C-terminal target domain-containing protein n=1 Tax=Parvicella tangerina TaxID=2829795 RepID=A0A916NRC2_9FLAO|nr:zinc-dependent metalloprotease [Parvicella tangerina]CAG5080846.1 hypothetical protein CRYO30217_01460 [Parvicella tangerina]